MPHDAHEEEPLKAALIYDGDCSFCRYWVDRWRSRVGDDVEVLSYQSRGDRFPQVPTDDLKRAVHYIDPYGAPFRGAEAVFRLMRHAPGRRWMLPVYQGVPGVKAITESVYSLVAANRNAAAPLTWLFWGKKFTPQERYIGRWLFLKNLGLIFFVAFFSLFIELPGLIGVEGVIPSSETVAALENTLQDERFLRFPSIFWFDISNEALQGGCILGMVVSVLLTLGIAPGLMTFFAWALYLSLFNVATEFLGFQWDILLLETAFLAIFLASWRAMPAIQKESRPSPVIIFLLWWLLFRLMFSSGYVKLDDPTWTNLSALTFHYETQPLPTWISWYAHNLPESFHRITCAAMFLIELAISFLIFFPRRLRHTGGIIIIAFQLVIAATGNYTFFNWLTIALCFLLFDDAFWRNVFPKSLRKRFLTPAPYQRIIFPRKLVAAILLITILPLSVVPTLYRLKPDFRVVPIVADTYEATDGFHLVNSYGLFAFMTTIRKEIIVEGSNDGVTWEAYEFKYKPGALDRRPRFIEPFQPRLDWQMWFAALGSNNSTPWFQVFVIRLLEGSPDVLRLFAYNPFPVNPPQYIRATTYQYHFTTPEERRQTGNWWKREEIGTYLEPVGFRRPRFR